jgi:diacylglycerol kinase family enzyme
LRVRVIVNTGGGSARAGVAEQLRALFSAEGIAAEIVEAAPDDVEDACAAAATAAGVDVVAAAGGDGTIATAAAALAGSGRPLGVLALGTLNHFARDAGIPAGLEPAVAAIVHGRHIQVDLAEVNGRIFINNSAVGLYPDMVRRRDAQQERIGRGKRLAMLSASLIALRHFRRHRLQISAAGLETPIRTPLLFVGNNRYQVNLIALGRRARLDQGELSIYAIKARSRLHLFWAGIRGVFGRLDQQRDFVTAYVHEAEIASDRDHLTVSMDGETRVLETPLRYRILPGALTLIVPAEAAPGAATMAR